MGQLGDEWLLWVAKAERLEQQQKALGQGRETEKLGPSSAVLPKVIVPCVCAEAAQVSFVK